MQRTLDSKHLSEYDVKAQSQTPDSQEQPGWGAHLSSLTNEQVYYKETAVKTHQDVQDAVQHALVAGWVGGLKLALRHAVRHRLDGLYGGRPAQAACTAAATRQVQN